MVRRQVLGWLELFDRCLSRGIFVGENKSLDHGLVQLHGGEDESRVNIPFSAPVGSPGATEPTQWLPGVGIPFPEGFLLLWPLL